MKEAAEGSRAEIYEWFKKLRERCLENTDLLKHVGEIEENIQMQGNEKEEEDVVALKEVMDELLSEFLEACNKKLGKSKAALIKITLDKIAKKYAIHQIVSQKDSFPKQTLFGLKAKKDIDADQESAYEAHQEQKDMLSEEGSIRVKQTQGHGLEKTNQKKETGKDFLSRGTISQTTSNLSADREVNSRQIIAGTYIEKNPRLENNIDSRIIVEGKVGSIAQRTGCVSNVGPTMFQPAAEHVQKLTREGMTNDIHVGSGGEVQTIESELGNIKGLPAQDSDSSSRMSSSFGHK